MDNITAEEKERNLILTHWYTSPDVKRFMGMLRSKSKLYYDRGLLGDIKHHVFMKLMKKSVEELRILNYSGGWKGYLNTVLMSQVTQYNSSFNSSEKSILPNSSEYQDYLHDTCFEMGFDTDLATKHDMLKACTEELNNLNYLEQKVLLFFAKYDQEAAALRELRSHGIQIANANYKVLLNSARDKVQENLQKKGIILRKIPYVRIPIEMRKGYSQSTWVTGSLLASQMKKITLLVNALYNKQWIMREKCLYILINSHKSLTSKEMMKIAEEQYDDTLKESPGRGSMAHFLNSGIVGRTTGKWNHLTEYWINRHAFDYINDIKNNGHETIIAATWRVYTESTERAMSFEEIADQFGLNMETVTHKFNTASTIINSIIEDRKTFLLAK